jgi:Fe-Mn family superoxide dismutase
MFSLDLPYDLGALEPALSRTTVMHHFDQQHCRHYERLAALVKGTELEAYSVDELVRLCARRPSRARLKVHVGRVWNHELYWHSLKPDGGGIATGPIAQCIRATFGDYRNFTRRLMAAASNLSGSGWLWVTWRSGQIGIVTTANTDSPIADGHTALLALDLWEHAYYLDYLGARSAYVKAWLEELVNWDFANQRLRSTDRVSQPSADKDRQPHAATTERVASPALAAANQPRRERDTWATEGFSSRLH